MKFAYADPPYLGCCKLYGHEHGEDGRCWDDPKTHYDLIDRLIGDYPDGWALSASASWSAFSRLTRKLADEPDVRMATWVKPFSSFKPNVNPAYTWEPVFFYGGRKGDRSRDTVKDHLIESITLQKGLTGAKPSRFAYWIFDLLGAVPTDSLDDLFPGTGIVGRCWDEFCGRKPPIQEGMLAL